MAGTRRLAAIMFTDIVGYTALAQRDEAGALKLLDRHNRLLRPIFPRFHGKEIKAIGDSFLVEFKSALDATNCAIEVQRVLNEDGASAPVGSGVSVRIGVHLGDVVHRGGDVFGDSVNIASRIEPLAEPGGICISEQVFGQVRNKIPNPLVKLEPKVLKNVQFSMDIYRITLPWTVPEALSPGPGVTRLAVLPFANISPDPKDEYFADGLTEELTTALSKIRDLRVIARTSVGQYKSTSKTVSQIGAELGVTSVLEGSVRKAGNQIRITLQLIDTGTQEHIWANSYDRELDDVFAVQTEIAEKTAGALRLELLGPERDSIRKESTTSLAAYNLYLKGIHATRRPEAYEGLTESIKFFEEAIRKDPAFPQPYARLANVLIGLAGDTLPEGECFSRARELVATALELDPNSSEAHTARGNLALQEDLDWGVSETEFKRAISLDPSNVNAHLWYAFLLRAVGNYEGSLKEFRTTMELDPLWSVTRMGLISVQSLLGDHDSAIESAEEVRNREPRDPYLHLVLGSLFATAGRMDDARKEAELAGGAVRTGSEMALAVLWAQLGKPERARRLAKQLEETSRTRYVSPAWIAAIYAALGEKERAFDWLERNRGEGARSLWIRYQSRAFDSIRDDPRFRSMLRKLNLPTEVSWVRGGGFML